MFEGNIEKLVKEMKTVIEFIYLDERTSTGGGCVVSVTARTIRGCV